MGQKVQSGVFQLDNGNWGYRYVLEVNGKRRDVRKTTDENRKPFKTERAAAKAREMEMMKEQVASKPDIPMVTFKDVYKEYCETGRIGKAYGTIIKQDSLWRNHISKAFGDRLVFDVSVAEVNDYLAKLYFIDGFSWGYTESFLKMFYLIFGQAYSRDYLDVDTYNKLCVNKNTKIKMPKMKAEDETDIIVFDDEELAALDDYFKGTNAETAYMLGRYAGLRVNECFGLKIDHIDVAFGTIKIDRQMQYQDGLIKLVAPKTNNSVRTIYMSRTLQLYFSDLLEKISSYNKLYRAQRKQNKTMIEDIDGTMIPCTELVNCLPNGKIQTVNTMKYHAKNVRKKLNIDFKFHYLRHTYGTKMADMNTPQHLLCNQMGHGNIHVTQKYYISISKSGTDILKQNLDQL